MIDEGYSDENETSVAAIYKRWPAGATIPKSCDFERDYVGKFDDADPSLLSIANQPSTSL